MYMHRKAVMLAGATCLSRPQVTRPRAPEVKDADPAKLSAEVKEAVDLLAKTFADFRSKNDDRLKEIEKKGSADVITKEELERINKAIDAAQDLVRKRTDELEAKLNRAAITGGPDTSLEAKALADFNLQTGQSLSPDEFRSYKSALYGSNGYFRRGDATPHDERKSLSVGSDPDGGYLVTPDTTGRIVKKVYETSPMRQICSVVTIGTDAYEGPIDNGEVDFGWVGEQAARNDTNTSQFGKWSIPVNEMYAQPKATQKVLDDSILDLEAWLAGKIGDKFSRAEAQAFVNGDGILKPKGILQYAFAATNDKSGRAWGTFEYLPTGVSGDFAASNPGDQILDLVYSLKAAYRQNARFLMSRATVGKIRKFKDGMGQYIWQPGAVAGQPATLFNYSIAEGEDMPSASTANALAILFGDFAETYTIVDRAGITVLRDPYTQKGFVKFYARRRVGGGANNFESMKALKFSAN